MTEGWQEATLAEKISQKTQRQGPAPINRLLSREARGLKVDWEFSAPQEWLDVRAKGEDADAFLNLLRGKFGEAPRHHSNIERWDVRRGFIIGSGRIGFGVYVDVGITEPAHKDALYPLHRMRAQLADGAVTSCRELLEENALTDDFPVKVLVTEIDGERLTVELADETRELFASWKKFPFDRVIAIGATKDAVEGAVSNARIEYDVIKVEPLSIFAHCLVCKIGTDAPGVIARIGNRLGGVALVSYRTKIGQMPATKTRHLPSTVLGPRQPSA
ncbi:hypothetical protein AUG19_06840 [archaeon 13_1_20CM_2_54_9]|nr:MAG: hypothetical protein AUJ07_12240 [Crenarchaeota archaeon 13_1_40CM_3_53_5]OLE74960.1 MAG: hypothetical protein AUG19_06840 [archaeon 13_1_20CM_2_54_9]TMI28272.1 MAG: DUF2110 family protein [Candidatus Bathyarchaeota archaeon]TMI31244.1 MAG: DUF2110 family protein [Candidatus Bathyarchaeota archaeon]